MGQETYPKAPIVEASFDIRVRLSSNTSLASLEKIRDPLYSELANKPTRMEIKVEANETDSSTVASASNTPLGFSFKTTDGHQVFQVRSDGFTHNQLAPYTNWDDFSAEAKRLWPAYKTGAQPEVIELIGLTYVNQISVPLGGRFEDYLAVYLHIPEMLPQVLNNFSFGFQVTDGENDCFVHMGQTYGPPKIPEHLSILLNIQAFKILNLPISSFSEEQIWPMFNKLRAAKNKAFEASITDRVREMIR